MNPAEQIAKHFREVYFGGNWTSTNLKDTLADVSWQHATSQVFGLNSIATLVYHISYYVSAVLKVLEGEPLNAKDAFSFDHPPINGPADWQNLLDECWAHAENFAKRVTHLQEHVLWEDFTDEKYGIYYRNIHGIIEHTHYHLGQIVVIKKILQQHDAL